MMMVMTMQGFEGDRMEQCRYEGGGIERGGLRLVPLAFLSFIENSPSGMKRPA